MTNTTFKQIKDLTGPELVAEYNRIAAILGRAEVKRFADRATGIKRVEAIRDDEQEWELNAAAPSCDRDQELIEMYGTHECPGCGINLENGVCCDGDEDGSATGRVIHLDTQFECMACGHGFGEKNAVNQLLSEGVAESWKDDEVRAKRVRRNKVMVDGTEYRSVKAAYIALGLPLSKHIKFRMELKEAGRIEVDGRVWSIV